MNKDFRIHITYRLKGQSVSDSVELKSESFDDVDELIVSAAENITLMVEEGNDGSNDQN